MVTTTCSLTRTFSSPQEATSRVFAGKVSWPLKNTAKEERTITRPLRKVAAIRSKGRWRAQDMHPHRLPFSHPTQCHVHFLCQWHHMESFGTCTNTCSPSRHFLQTVLIQTRTPTRICPLIGQRPLVSELSDHSLHTCYLCHDRAVQECSTHTLYLGTRLNSIGVPDRR